MSHQNFSIFEFFFYFFLSFDHLNSKVHPEKSKTFSFHFIYYVVNPKFQGVVYSLGIYTYVNTTFMYLFHVNLRFESPTTLMRWSNCVQQRICRNMIN